MLYRLKHNLKLAAPLLGLAGVLTLAFRVAIDIGFLVQAERPASRSLAAIGEGLDVLTAQISPFMQSVMDAVNVRPNLLNIVAIVATAISLLAVLVHLLKVVRGTGDAVGFVSHLLDRVKLTSYEHWGTARDVHSNATLAFARVRLVDGSGAVLASTTADINGRYGFSMPLEQAYINGHSLEAVKGGYYFPPKARRSVSSMSHYHGGPLPIAVTWVPNGLDVYLESKNPEAGKASWPRGMFGSVITAAFWISILAVPLAAASSPNVFTAVLSGALVVSMLARMGGLGKNI